MIIELVGLPGAGKTTLAQALAREHDLPVVSAPTRLAPLAVEGLLGAILRPAAASSLFRLIMRERNTRVRHSLFINGWLGSSAKYWRARRGGVIDQGYAQALVAALPQNEDLALVRSVLANLREGIEIVWCNTDTATRVKRLARRAYQPREEFGSTETERFAKEGERSYRAVKDIFEHMPRRTSRLRNTLKLSIYLVAYGVRMLARLARREPEVVVLMYHAIDRSGWKLSVTPEMFERQMKYLVRKGWAVPLADVVSYAKGEKKLPAHAVAVTFDDGYRDVLDVALPILERYRIPATIFIPSDLSVQTGPDSRPRLTEEEVRRLARSPLITVGSHAVTHRKFPELPLEEIRNELKASADALAHIVGNRPRFFAYPFGARSADAERAARDAGYGAAFGITEGTIHQGDDLFRLKRVQIDGTMSPLLFRLRLTGAVDLNRRIVDLLRRA